MQSEVRPQEQHRNIEEPAYENSAKMMIRFVMMQKLKFFKIIKHKGQRTKVIIYIDIDNPIIRYNFFRFLALDNKRLP